MLERVRVNTLQETKTQVVLDIEEGTNHLVGRFPFKKYVGVMAATIATKRQHSVTYSRAFASIRGDSKFRQLTYPPHPQNQTAGLSMTVRPFYQGDLR